MSGRGRLVGAVVAVLAAAAVLAASAPGLDVSRSDLAALRPGPASTTPSTTPSTAPAAPSTSTTTAGPGDGSGRDGNEGPDENGPGGLDAATVECLLGDVLDDPGGALGGGVTGPPAEQIRQLAEAVEEERGLEFTTEVAPELVTDEEIAERVRELNDDAYPAEEADADDRLLTALGAIPADLDLRQELLDLTAGQVAGYYEPATGDLVVLADDPDEPLDAGELLTVAHELDHALTDQHLDIPVGDDAPDGDDAATAALAVVEGDATVVMQRVALTAAGLDGLLGSAGGSADEQAQLAATPPFLRSSLLFPYLEGMRFVCDVLADGGWAAVDDAYRDPPAATVQVLFPDRYGETPVPPPPLASPGSGWEELDRDTFGAAALLWLLEAPGGDEGAALDDARGRVAAWAGDEAVVWGDGDATAVGLTFAARPADGAPALCDTVADWHRASFPDAVEAATGQGEALAAEGPAGAAVVRCDGGGVRLGVAPDLVTARAVLGG